MYFENDKTQIEKENLINELSKLNRKLFNINYTTIYK
jgi:hypothetical protein